jgi:hypothetical protein
MTIHVLFNSPESRHPEFGPTGLVLGLTVVPLGNSLTEPNPFGSTAKLALLQILAACAQSLATIGGGGGGGQARQLIEIENPGASMIASEVNLSVRQPPVEVIAAGSEVPVKGLPITCGAAVLEPL